MEENDTTVGQEEALTESNLKTQSSNSTEQPIASMADLLKETDLSIEFPQAGETRQGTIVRISDSEILVSIGAKSEGVILGRELEHIPADEREKLKEGDIITVYVLTPEDQSGNLQLSYMRAREESDWRQVEDLLKSGEVYQGQVSGYNKGGLIVPIGILRGFVPTSQVSMDRRPPSDDTPADRHWSKMVDEPIKVRVIEVDRNRSRLILSERAALQESREALKDRLLDELEQGAVRTGKVTSLAEFGAFVNLDGADGLVHLSEISWDHIDHPSDVLSVGQEVQVKVISLDRERKRIGLSIRQLQEDPWTRKVKALQVGQLVEGTITHLAKFGAFARINDDDDLEGLIHISEISEQRIAHPKEVLKEGDKVTLRVIKIEMDRKRIGLSLRKVDSAQYTDLDWKMALADEVKEVAPSQPEDLQIEESESISPVEQSYVAVEVTPEGETHIEEMKEVKKRTEAKEQTNVKEQTKAKEQTKVLEQTPAEGKAKAEKKTKAEEKIKAEDKIKVEQEPMAENNAKAVKKTKTAKKTKIEEQTKTEGPAKAEEQTEAINT
jgi:small subunit ribosomal protein S1